MKYILIGGAPSVGKTGAIYRLAHYFLIQGGFVDTLKTIPQTQNDFMAILEGKNDKGERIRIAINSATDTPEIIQSFKTLLDDNENIDLIISSIRDAGFDPREDFFGIMGIPENEICIEVPLAKITRRGENRKTSLEWYTNKIDSLLIKLIDSLSA